MQHLYTVNPVKHQPQWPTSPEPTRSSKVVTALGYSLFGLLFLGISALGLLSMTVAP